MMRIQCPTVALHLVLLFFINKSRQSVCACSLQNYHFSWRCSAGDLGPTSPAVLKRIISNLALPRHFEEEAMYSTRCVRFNSCVTVLYLPPSLRTGDDWQPSPVHIKVAGPRVSWRTEPPDLFHMQLQCFNCCYKRGYFTSAEIKDADSKMLFVLNVYLVTSLSSCALLSQVMLLYCIFVKQYLVQMVSAP